MARVFYLTISTYLSSSIIHCAFRLSHSFVVDVNSLSGVVAGAGWRPSVESMREQMDIQDDLGLDCPDLFYQSEQF